MARRALWQWGEEFRLRSPPARPATADMIATGFLANGRGRAGLSQSSAFSRRPEIVSWYSGVEVSTPSG